MTYEYAKEHAAEIEAQILKKAEPIPSVAALPKFLREHGAICVCVVDGKIIDAPRLDLWAVEDTSPEQYAANTIIGGVPLASLIQDKRICACMVPM